MDRKTRLGLMILGAALFLGVSGDLLFNTDRWGINLPIWVGLLVLTAAYLARGEQLKGDGYLMAVPALVAPICFAWRDSLTLRTLDVMVIAGSLMLASARLRYGLLKLAGFLEYLVDLLVVWVNSIFGVFLLVFSDISWSAIPRGGWTRHVMAVARGLVIATPLLLVFGLLFAAADAVFEGIVKNTLKIDTDTLVLHAFVVSFISWLVAGWLRSALLAEPLSVNKSERPSFLYLGIVETSVVMGLIDLLFLAFVLVQIKYFFGGAAHVDATSGLTYAEYARRGFFELVTVAALVLPMLLALHWLLRVENALHEKLFRVFAAIQIGLLFVVMASALERMRLYRMEYGLTELRLYTTAFMIWLGLVFLLFALTVLRGRREQFAWGTLWSGFAALLIVHAINPDDLIVRTNAARVGKPFDAHYAASLSDDAIPALIDTMPQMQHMERVVVADRVLRTTKTKQDWRGWSLSRSRALAAAKKSLPMLEQIAQNYFSEGQP